MPAKTTLWSNRFLLLAPALLISAALLNGDASAARPVAHEKSPLERGTAPTNDAHLLLVPQGAAPPNGGSVTVGGRFVLDLMLYAGSHLDLVAQQSYLTFTHSRLQNASVPEIATSCDLTNTLTPDLVTFDAATQNEVCNGPGSCGTGGEVALEPGSIAFASMASANCPAGCGGRFRVAQIGLCATAPGQAVLRWQFAPPDRESQVRDINGNQVQDPALFEDYVINVVDNVTGTPSPTPAPTHTPTATETPCAQQTALAEGFESNSLGLFYSSVTQCSSGGCGWRPVTDNPYSGIYAAFAPNVSSIADQRMILSNSLSIPLGISSATLSFRHRHVFDAEGSAYYDGAVLETSTNGGALWTDVLSNTNFISGGYDGVIVFGHFNPLARRQAWGGYNAAFPGFNQVVVNLLPYAGQNMLFRFREGTDHVVGAQGWWIDDIEITLSYPCSASTPTSTPTPTGTPTATPVLVGHVTWQGPPAQPHTRQQQPVTLTLKLDAAEVNYPSVTTDSSGFFTIPLGTLAAGTYSWRAKGPKYLANSGTIECGMRNAECGIQKTESRYSAFRIPHSAFVEVGLMKVGDANDDNRVTTSDFNIVKNTFGKGCPDPGYDDRGDFNADCIVNVLDVNLLKGNFGLGGAPPIGPQD